MNISFVKEFVSVCVWNKDKSRWYITSCWPSIQYLSQRLIYPYAAGG